MKKFLLLPLLALSMLCGCISKPQTVQQQLAERLDFENSTSCRLLTPDAARKMAEEYFAEAEFIAAQLPNRKLILECTSLGTVLYHASGLGDLLVAGESSRPLSTEKNAPLYLNRFSAAAAPDTQGFLWHLLDAPPQKLRPFIAALPEQTLFAVSFTLTPEKLLDALKAYADTTPENLEKLCRKKFNRSAAELLKGFSGQWDILLFAADNKLHYKISLPDRNGNLALPGRVLLPLLKRHLPGWLPAPELTTPEGRLVIASANAEKFLSEASPLTKSSPALDYLIRQLPADGNGFFYFSSDFSKFLLPEPVVQRGKCKFPFILGVVSSTGSMYDLLSLSNCDIAELQLFSALLLPLRRGSDFFFAQQQKNQQQTRANRLRNITGRQCAARLGVVSRKLQEYAASHQGSFPENLTELELAGNVLVCPAVQYSPYVYFQGFTTKDNPRFPLVCDFQPHGKQLNVILLNGELHTFAIEGDHSLKQLVSTLHSRFKYSEKELQMLLDKISTVDKTME